MGNRQLYTAVVFHYHSLYHSAEESFTYCDRGGNKSIKRGWFLVIRSWVMGNYTMQLRLIAIPYKSLQRKALHTATEEVTTASKEDGSW